MVVKWLQWAVSGILNEGRVADLRCMRETFTYKKNNQTFDKKELRTLRAVFGSVSSKLIGEKRPNK